MTPLLKIVGITIVAAGLGGQIPRPQIISAPMSDEAITANVEREFRTNPQLGGLSIDVSTAKAMVTLEGSVRSLIEKQRADALCRQAAGVAGVINRLQVEQSQRPLDQLATTITERFASDQLLAQAWISSSARMRASSLLTGQLIILACGSMRSGLRGKFPMCLWSATIFGSMSRQMRGCGPWCLAN